jgi:hypothetical protein
MTEKEIFDLMRSTLYRFYLRPSYLLKSLRRVGNFDNFITKAVTAGRLLFRLA